MATTLILKNPAAAAPDAPPVRTDDRGVRRLGFLILLVAFGGFGTWAATAKLDNAAYAPGVVMVESYRKTVQHREGGIVKEILVRDGTLVREGDVVLRLDDTQDRARLEIIRSQYLALRALESRLVAERDQSAVIQFPVELASVQVDGRVKETLIGQTRVFEARRDALRSEISVLEQRIDQLQAQIEGLDALQKTEQQRIESLQEERDDFRKLYREGHADKLRLRALDRDIAELEGERAEHLAMIARAKIQIGETRLQILNLQKKFQSEVVTELRDVQTKIFDLEERIRALEDVLARTEIRSPAAGTVVGLGMHTVGGVIAPGNPILDIVPEDTHLVVEAQVQPTDIDKVKAGLLADIRFSAFKTRLTPVVEGMVLTVSADRLINPTDKHPYYLARIEVSPEGLRQLHDQRLLPGMPAEVIIKTGERTFLDYLVRPLTDAFARSFIED